MFGTFDNEEDRENFFNMLEQGRQEIERLMRSGQFGPYEQMLRSMMGDAQADAFLREFKQANNIPDDAAGESSEAPSPTPDTSSDPLDEPPATPNFPGMTYSPTDVARFLKLTTVDWDEVERSAIREITSQHYDSVSSIEGDECRAALRVADLWLDSVTDFTPSGAGGKVWSRIDWVSEIMPTFKAIGAPVAEGIIKAFVTSMEDQLRAAGLLGDSDDAIKFEMPSMDDLPDLPIFDSVRELMSNPSDMLNKVFRPAVAALVTRHYQDILVECAPGVFGAHDAGLPVTSDGYVALMPTNIQEFFEGMDLDHEESLLYAAVREQATARLFHNTPWLRPHILDIIRTFSEDITFDVESMRKQIQGMGLTPDMLAQPLTIEINISDLFNMEHTDRQKEAIAELSHVFSLIDGWVTTVTHRAVLAQLPHVMALSEMYNRRLAANNPISELFGSLIGMEVRPSLVREANDFWMQATTRLGDAERDALWKHPDIMPSPEALASPESYFNPGEQSDIESELDAWITSVLNEADGDPEPGTPA